ncbi:MAG: hypothetical protein U0821_25090 [Chloroflexota bacterium]
MVVAPPKFERAKGKASFERLSDEITSARYREAAETYCRLIAEEDKPIKDVIRAAVSCAAPYVQVPSHLMQKPDGESRGVNYDHTVLGWRGAISLMPHMSTRRAALPTVQAMWYVPQGLNIWEQIICQFPGHYARDAEKCNDKYPGEDEEVNRFDGPSWTPPRVYFEDHEPITQGSVDDRVLRFNWAISEGNKEEAYGLFLGLAQDPAHKKRLEEAVLFAGITDLQDTVINRGGYQNIGHKALRARAMVDIAEYLGWENAHDIIYTVVPDLGCSPRLYGLWTEVNNLSKIELSDLGDIPKRGIGPVDGPELDSLTRAMLWGGPFEINAEIVRLYRRGHGSLDLLDAIAVAYQRYLMDVIEHPSAFLHPMHSFDYLNVVHKWVRDYDSRHHFKGAFMAARFSNDTIRANAMFPRDPKVELESRRVHREWADSLALDRLLGELVRQILAEDAPRSCALVDSYLERTGERRNLLDSITYAACHFQNDPHVMRNCMSTIEEFTVSQSPRRDDIIRGYAKVQSRYIKRAQIHEAFELYANYFDPDGVER